jgi:predicted membrane chloride channel (bestrophin family)
MKHLGLALVYAVCMIFGARLLASFFFVLFQPFDGDARLFFVVLMSYFCMKSVEEITKKIQNLFGKENNDI